MGPFPNAIREGKATAGQLLSSQFPKNEQALDVNSDLEHNQDARQKARWGWPVEIAKNETFNGISSTRGVNQPNPGEG